MRRRCLARAMLVLAPCAGSVACAQIIGLTDGEARDESVASATDGGDAASATDADQTLDGDTDARPRPFTQLALGSAHTCALIMPGGAVRCWGSSDSYRLGNQPGVGQRLAPRDGAPLRFGAGWQTQTIVAGSAHTCALSVDHRVKCWGGGLSGQLGIGPLPSMSGDGIEPGALLDEEGEGSLVDLGPGAEPIALATGMQHTCAVLRGRDGEPNPVKCWGGNSQGALGLERDREGLPSVGLAKAEMGGNLEAVHFPSNIGSPTLIAAGYNFTCVTLTPGNKVYCWGENGFDQLGVPSTVHRSVGTTPGDMASVSPFLPEGAPALLLAIPSIGTHVCAAQGSSAVCWGANNFAQAGAPASLPDSGTGGFARDRPPVDFGVGVPPVTSLATGNGFSCATFEDGAVRCWGNSSDGQLGLGTDARSVPASAQPIDLGTGVRAERVYAGANHACVVTRDNQVKCWGSNEFGQLGTGDTKNRGDVPNTMGDALLPLTLE